MRYDEAKIDEAVLAVLYLTAWEEHGLTRAWKGVDWKASSRLHEHGLIDDPKNKNKTVIFTEEDLARARCRGEALLVGARQMITGAVGPTGAGRIVGGLVLVQMVGGFLVNFVLDAPLFGPPGFLITASAHAAQIALSAILGLSQGALGVGIAVAVYPLARSHAPALSLWLLIFTAAGLAAAVAEQISVMSMVSLGRTANPVTRNNPACSPAHVIAASYLKDPPMIEFSRRPRS
jgi:hypothetical protein